ncbi:MAG: hypothetical protein ACI4DO_08225 [Roseburia sp.]
MKNIVFGMVGGILILLFSVMLVMLQSRSVRREELKLSLAEAMEAAMKQAGRQQFGSNQELSDYFVRTFTEQVNSDSQIQIRVICADVSEGILSVEVEQTYQYINGKTGSISCSRTMLLERTDTANGEPEYCTVTFYLDQQDMENQGNYYKQYEVAMGDVVHCPVAPAADYGKGCFLEWRDAAGYLADFSQGVTQDVTYYAVYE